MRRMDDYANKPKIMEYLAELIYSQLEERKPKEIPEGLSVEDLVKIAADSHMNYLILGALIRLPLEEDEIKALRSRLMSSTMKTLQQVCAARDIQEVFEKEGIRNQVLKGAVMKHIYPRPEMREMSDIDFMVYETNFDKAEEILTRCGFEKEQAVKHHVIFRKKPYLICEMHWSLYEQTVDKEQYLYYKDQFRAKLKEGCQYTYEFSKEDFYVYLISHMAKHFYENGCGIRNLLDIYIYQKVYGNILNKELVAKELEKCGLTEFERHARRLAEIWLTDTESTEFYNHMFMYMLDCGIYGKSENGIWGQLAKQAVEEKESKGMLRLRYYFPAMDYMKEYYPWVEKNKVLLPVAWMIRGINGISRKDARERMHMLDDNEKFDITKEIYQRLNLNFSK